MRILHLGDLHFGKRVNNLPLIEDQRYMNEEIYKVIDEQGIDAVMIAGDVYDKSVPSEEAVSMLDDFLYELGRRKKPILIIAGNHDSAERLSFGDRWIEVADIYISPVYNGEAKKVTLKDNYGKINFYLMPFVKPNVIKHCFPDEEIETYTDALGVAIRHMNVAPSERNIILSHQFVTGSTGDGSEDELYVGGSSNVDSSVYDMFDYAALGHIHKPQDVDHNTVRYCGSPMKFSFNEEKQEKGLTIVEIKEKGDVSVEIIPTKPLRDFVTLRGTYAELKKGNAEVGPDDFVSIILTDEEHIPNAFSNLATVYKGIQKITYDNKRSNNKETADGTERSLDLKPIEIMEEFYQLRNGKKMSDEQAAYIEQLIDEIWGGEA